MIFFFLYRKVVQQLVSWCQLPTIDHCSRTFVCIAPMLFCFPSPRHSALKSAKYRATFFHTYLHIFYCTCFFFHLTKFICCFSSNFMNSSKNKKKLWRFFFHIFGHFLRNEQRKCRWKSTTIDWVCPKKSPDNAIWYRKPYEETFNLWNSTLHDWCERACLWNTSPFQVFTLQGYKWKGTGQEKLFWNFCPSANWKRK